MVGFDESGGGVDEEPVSPPATNRSPETTAPGSFVADQIDEIVSTDRLRGQPYVNEHPREDTSIQSADLTRRIAWGDTPAAQPQEGGDPATLDQIDEIVQIPPQPRK